MMVILRAGELHLDDLEIEGVLMRGLSLSRCIGDRVC